MRDKLSFALLTTLALASAACDAEQDLAFEEARGGAIPGRWLMPQEIAAISAQAHVDLDGSPPGPHSPDNCTPWLTPGAVVLHDYIEAEFGFEVGGYACRAINNKNGPNKTSIHGVGRALDIYINCKECEADNVAGDPLAHWLIEHAEEIGVQKIIWDDSVWKGDGRSQTTDYGGSHDHHDHIHVEINLEAAYMQTAWFEDQGYEEVPEIPEAPVPPEGANEGGETEPEPPPLPDRIWYLRHENQSGAVDQEFHYGAGADVPLLGDWDGDGIDTPAVFRDGRWFLRNANSTGAGDIELWFGNPGDTPVVGDWDGDGVDTVGVVRDGQWFLRNDNSTGAAQLEFWFGGASDTPVVGDWDGDGIDSPGVFRAGQWFLRNQSSDGPVDIELWFGGSSDVPVAGDWNGDGVDSPGVFRDGQWFLRNQSSDGPVDIELWFGGTGDAPLVGDFVGEGVTTVAVSRDV